jgi:GTPase SAR1 family protein
MWDTCGQERYRSNAHTFYRGACAIIFVYDVTDADSFLNLRAWKFDVDSVNQDTNLIKVGNTGIRQRLREMKHLRFINLRHILLGGAIFIISSLINKARSS